MRSRTLTCYVLTLFVASIVCLAAVAQSEDDERNQTLDDAWAISFLSNPTVLTTEVQSPLTFATFNPKDVVKVARVSLVFKKGADSVFLVEAFPHQGVALEPGACHHWWLIDGNIVRQAKERGADQVKIKLLVAGKVRSSDLAQIDYDLMATVSASATYGVKPLEVSFQASVTGGVQPYTYKWVFGDGAESSEQNPTHLYTSTGLYGPSFIVTDAIGGQVESATGTIYVY